MEAPPENEPLRKYLNRITMQLMFGIGIPRAERLTIRQELTLHLSAMIEDDIAEGASREKATLEALRRFGNPNKVGKDIRKEWKHNHKALKPPNSAYRRLRLLFAFLLILLVMDGYGHWFPTFVDSERQISISLAIFHAAIHSIVFLSAIMFILIGTGRINKELPNPMQEFGGTHEERAKAFADELGMSVSQEKIERSRALEGKIKRVMKMIGIIFVAVPALALIYVILSPTLSYADKLPWCYQISWFMFLVLGGAGWNRLLLLWNAHKTKA